MIIKSYEIEKKISNLIKLNLVLLYGENNGLKKDVREIIIKNFKKEKDDIEFLSFYEDENNELLMVAKNMKVLREAILLLF